jgi:phosphatidate phosphatase APP1
MNFLSYHSFHLVRQSHNFDLFVNDAFCTGSIKLRSYAGRSLFNGLLSAPAARKRAGVVDVLDSFPDSRFFLIGDSGEQDLELYAEYAFLFR